MQERKGEGKEDREDVSSLGSALDVKLEKKVVTVPRGSARLRAVHVLTGA